MIDKGHPGAKRFKLFHDGTYCGAVKAALVEQLGLSEHNPKVRLCLVAGKIAGGDPQKLQDHFKAKDWMLDGPEWVQKGVTILASDGYENDIVTMTAKILVRSKTE